MALVDLKSDLTWYGKPPVVNYFPDKASGTKGFTDKMDTTQYLNTTRDTYNYPPTVIGSRLMQPVGTAKFPGPQNFISDVNSGAKGFTLNMDKLPRPDKSEFLGIDAKQYKYPNTVLGSRLMQPAGTTNSGPIVKFPGPQNFFDDNLSGARGFTLNINPVRRYEKSEFIGIRGLTYTYPTTLATGDRLMKPRLSTSFPGPQNFFGDVNATGFTENMWKTGQSKKQSQFTGITEGGYQYPSNLNEKFNALNIVDNSYNTTYVPQPYVVRGMQRKGKANEKPQYWGFGSKSGFDDGLIRGGAVTVADRVIADTKRISQFMASPKGLLWIVKQFGLGLSNPKVEVNPLAPIRQTRVHLGVTSLLSVPGSPFGLHFTRHGIPFANEVSSYGNVQLAKGLINSNRLVDLWRELNRLSSATALPANNKQAFQLLKNIIKGTPIIALSGPAGPQSVYGVGSTPIRRVVDSINDAFYAARQSGFPFKYGRLQGSTFWKTYASALRANTFSVYDTRPDELNPRDASAVDTAVGNWGSIRTKLERDPSLKDTAIDTYTPGAGKNIAVDISSNSKRKSGYPDAPQEDINNHITLAYNKIPKRKNGSVTNDFRAEIAKNGVDAKQANLLGMGNTDPVYYRNNNLQEKYGFGDLGKVGADRTNPNSFGKTNGVEINGSDYDGSAEKRKVLLENGVEFRGDRINALDVVTKTTLPAKPTTIDSNVVYAGERDLIKFYFQDGEHGKNVMVFRATITGLTDSFSPGWDKIDIMGRPDGAYIYTSYERTVSFNFRVAALSRGEMIPIWRKLNYLSTYTMPDLHSSKQLTGRVSGPFMRITIGDMFQNTPGFITSLSYTIPDDTSWDIADDSNTNVVAKQLPTVIDVAMSYTVVADYRPQLNGRAYSLSADGNSKDGPDNWLQDAQIT